MTLSEPRITAEQLRAVTIDDAVVAEAVAQAADTIEALTAERDEARLMYQGAALCDERHLQEAADYINARTADWETTLKASQFRLDVIGAQRRTDFTAGWNERARTFSRSVKQGTLPDLEQAIEAYLAEESKP